MSISNCTATYLCKPILSHTWLVWMKPVLVPLSVSSVPQHKVSNESIQIMPGPVKHLCLMQWFSCQSNAQMHPYTAWTPNPGKHVVMAQKWTRMQPAGQLMMLSAYILIHSSSCPLLHVYKESDIAYSKMLPHYPLHHKVCWLIRIHNVFT